MSKHQIPRIVLLYAAIMAASSLTAFLLAEGVYRMKLAVIIAEPANPSSENVFGAQNRSLWEFDREFGYVYPPNRVVTLFEVTPKGVRSCGNLTINAYGNIGRIKGDYSSASLKVLVFGDSFSAISFGGMTWPDYLQDRLQERLKRPAHVVNFGRDGYGILQMFDLAKAKVREWRPDVVIFAFSTDDLTRARFWRTVVEIDGLTRVLTTIKPDPEPAIQETADTYILYPPASLEWCKAMEGTGQRDHHVEGVEKVHRRIQKDRSVRFNLYALDRSYLYERLRYGHPVTAIANPPVNPRHHMDSFLEDEQFKEAVAVLEGQSAPYFLIHLPFYPEYVANQYLLNGQESRLRENLAKATRRPVIGLLDPAGSPVKAPEQLRAAESDFHPSSLGQQLYADQVAKLLINRLNLR